MGLSLAATSSHPESNASGMNVGAGKVKREEMVIIAGIDTA